MSNAYRSVLESGGGVTPTGDALVSDVLAGKTFSNANNVGLEGTMPNNGAVSQTIQPGGSYTIPAGYHNGSGVVNAAAATGYEVIELLPFRNASGSSHLDRNITAQVGDYLALTETDSGAYLSCPDYISETSEITITGAVKIYKVDQAMSSTSVRMLAGGDTGGAFVHIRRV